MQVKWPSLDPKLGSRKMAGFQKPDNHERRPKTKRIGVPASQNFIEVLRLTLETWPGKKFRPKRVQRVTVSELFKVRRDKEPYTGWGF